MNNLSSIHASSEASKAAVEQVIALGRRSAEQGWVVATGGNFSVRVDPVQAFITATGTDKGALTPEQVLPAAISMKPPVGASAEADIHLHLYRADPAIGAIVHVHSPASIVLSRLEKTETVTIEGYELLKAISGVKTHEARLDVPLWENSQDISTLAVKARDYAKERPIMPAFLLRGHGLTAWGKDANEAFRHAEALEFLFSLMLTERRYSR
jgi:methylthioribulose-1-phosphate dehydratase